MAAAPLQARRLPATSPRHKGSAGHFRSCSSSLLPTTAAGAGMAGGRQERTDSPAEEGGRHPQGRNEEEDSGAAGVAPRRGGTTGKRRPPRQVACRRHNAIAPARCLLNRVQPGSISRQAIVIRMDRDAQRAARRRTSGVERGHAEGVRRP